MNKYKPSFINRLIKSKLVVIFEVLILVVLASALAQEIIRKYQIENEIRELQAEVSSLEENNLELKSLIGYFNSDSYKEEQARLKLGLQKPGESVITVLGAETGSEAIQEEIRLANNKTEENIPNPRRWWNYFFNNTHES